MISRETLLYLDRLVNSLQLPANHPEFEQEAAGIVKVKRELADALAETAPEAP